MGCKNQTKQTNQEPAHYGYQKDCVRPKWILSPSFSTYIFSTIFMFVFQKSFSRAIDWVKELRQQANAQIVMVLAGNKADMASEKRAVSREVSV